MSTTEEKLDHIIQELSDFRVDVAEKIGSLPCGEHKEAIKSVRSRTAIVMGIILTLFGAICAMALK